MALGDVGQFVGQHAGQFFFLVQVHYQTGEHVNIAAGYSKGVKGVVQYGAGSKGERLRRNGFDQPAQHIVHILLYLRVFDDRQV